MTALAARPADPAVSIVMAAYNGAALLPPTLASVSAQTLGDFELLVVDDRSTDDTRDIVAAWPDARVRLIALSENGGPVNARNRAVAEARGRFIAGLDQDDLCRPDRLARQVAYLDAHPQIVLVGANADNLYGDTLRPPTYAPITTPALVTWLSWIENPLVWSSVMMRGDAARALSPFTRPDLSCAEDFNLYHRIQQAGGLARIDDVLLAYRQHPGGMSKRYATLMHASATRALAEFHGPILGDHADTIAALLVRHNMGKQPVPDRETLWMLGNGIATLQTAFLASHPCYATDLRLIRWETALRWGGIGRAALRTGSVGLHEVLAVRPDHLGLGYAGIDALMWSAMVGGGRRGQAFVEKIIRPAPSRANT
ncbi:glycosyltransferase family 2 protein [uncultured Sphingomonas sp.]|uniref:glycosyltransferase family 2 protein n=1 Tax=uncultured Sphingomonas sp. TaxID=158754 RepID=UPI0035CAC4CD